MAFLKTFFWLFLLLLLLPVTYAVAPATYKQLLIVLEQRYVIYGMLAFVIVYYIFLRRRIRFFQTLDHELSHAIVSLCFGHRVTELHATWAHHSPRQLP